MYSFIASRSALHARVSQVSRVAAGRINNARYSSTMHDNDPEVLEKEKLRNLTKIQHQTSSPYENAPGWNEYLATTSEAFVKADHDTSVSSPEELQRKTVDYVHSRHSPDDRVSPREAVYSRDTVLGPLGAKTEELQSKKIDSVDSQRSPDDHLSPSEAVYSHDTVLGPLGEKLLKAEENGEDNVVKRTVKTEEVTEEVKKT